MLIYSKSNYYDDTIIILYCNGKLYWYCITLVQKKGCQILPLNRIKKCAYMHMYNFMLYITIYNKNTY